MSSTITAPKPAAPKPAGAPSAPSRKKSRKMLYIIIGVVAIGLAVAAKMKSGSGEKPVMITTDKAVVKNITQLVSATGKIQPEVEVKISPEVAGEITELPFREGAPVKKGDMIIKIKPDNYQAQVEQADASLVATRAAAVLARAQLIKAEQDFKQSEELHGQKLVSDSDFITNRTNLDVAKSNVDSALAQIRKAEGALNQSRDQLSKTIIYAPMDGSVSSRTSEVGERVVGTGQFAGTEVMRVADLTNMEIRVNVNENDVVNVKVGDHALIAIDSYPGRKFNGSVKEIATTATTTGAGTQEEVTNFQVKIRITDKDSPLRPGMSGTADIETSTVTNVVAVPVQSVTVRSIEGNKTAEEIQQDRDKAAAKVSGDNKADVSSSTGKARREREDREKLQRVVFIKNGDKVRLQKVETGISDNSHIEIKNGVKAGDEVVAGSYSALSRKLKDGMKVQIEKTVASPEKK
ncbi:MAG TPA: efflux RND transporter periplasmic adaptor subunit [Opitutaceae bacterium]|nr:efflux RND transporter periplasmic adaptor subunit [Opitutaceae bacterium]